MFAHAETIQIVLKRQEYGYELTEHWNIGNLIYPLNCRDILQTVN